VESHESGLGIRTECPGTRQSNSWPGELTSASLCKQQCSEIRTHFSHGADLRLQTYVFNVRKAVVTWANKVRKEVAVLDCGS